MKIKTKINPLSYNALLKSFAFLLLIGSQLLHAREWHYRCDNYLERTLLSSKIEYTSSLCHLNEDLKLSRTNYSYPLLGELQVDYWQGNFQRAAIETNHYEDNVYNCFGRWKSSTQNTVVSKVLVHFSVDNPNLHDDVSLSYMANAPMTDQEAKIALEKAKSNCESAVNKDE